MNNLNAYIRAVDIIGDERRQKQIKRTFKDNGCYEQK